MKFQPTRPLRVATQHFQTNYFGNLFQPTRPLRGATVLLCILLVGFLISTHAPLAGRDFTKGRGVISNIMISTHAPLAGRDCVVKFNNRFHVNFNPRAPCGARRSEPSFPRRAFYFNPRAPCGARPPNRVFNPSNSSNISTHAPLAGRDSQPEAYLHQSRKFQPTRPLRGATVRKLVEAEGVKISTHAPLAGRDCPVGL